MRQRKVQDRRSFVRPLARILFLLMNADPGYLVDQDGTLSGLIEKEERNV